jgi:bacterioferritin-associated ferredoxin
MYACICNAVTESQVRQCAEQGICSVADVKRCLQFKSGCGRCSSHIRELVKGHASNIHHFSETHHAR